MARSTVGAAADRTLRMTVANMGFMLDRLGRDCTPLQFLRELTQNSIEAIRRKPGQSGNIVWDVDWDYYDLTDVMKLCIIDDGVGMTGDEMVRYINALSSSIHEQSHEGNFGVGAKVAAATRNHEGLVYLSWKDGVGSTVHLWRDPETNEYGLRQFELPDGTYQHWGLLEDTVKPTMIDQSGTKVVLLGNDPEQATMVPPEGTPSPSRWISRYLNTRYFDFPDGITLRAREGWENPRSDKDRNLLRKVTGMRPYLEQHAEKSGTVPLDGAVAHWWILKDEPALQMNSGFTASNGHIAALHDSELYEMQTARSGTARLQQFGIIFGYTRVVIYVSPKNGRTNRIESNTARTHLTVNGEPLPWAEWAGEFRDKMPPDLEELMERVAAGSESHDHSHSIRERLKAIIDLFKFSRYRPTPTGTVSVEDPTTGGSSRSGGNSGGAGARGGPGGGSRPGSVYALFLRDEGTPGEAVRGQEPRVEWVRASDNTRAPGDMEDRAAKYLPDQNLILANGDFRAFTDMVDRWAKQYERVPGATSVIRDVVEEWFQQTLVETVMGVQALRGSKEWSVDQISAGWSEEALSAAVMPRYHIDVAIKRALGSKLGKLAG